MVCTTTACEERNNGNRGWEREEVYIHNWTVLAIAFIFQLGMIPEAPKPANLNLGVVDDNAKATFPTATTQMKILEPEMIALQRCLKAC